MKIIKGYSHLYQSNIPTQTTVVQELAPPPETNPAPAPAPSEPPPVSPATPPSFQEMENTDYNPSSYETKKSIIPKLVIIGLVLVIAFLIWKLIPRTYEDCASLPLSKVEGNTCTTFYRKSFSNIPTANPTATNPPANEAGSQIDFPYPSTTPSPTSVYIPTTKGGNPLVTPIPTLTPAPGKTSSKPPAPKNTQPPQTPIPTSPPSTDSSVPSDWIKHRYPDQKISFWLPKGWSASNAVYNTSTGLTTIVLGGPDSVVVTVRPNWNDTGDVRSTSPNYQVKDSTPAYKITNNTTTTVYFEKNSQVYQYTCQNSLWSTCHIILQNLEF